MVAGLAISSVGSLLQASSQTARTIAINPTAVGNLVQMAIVVESSTSGFAPSAVTGGHCVGLTGLSSWTNLLSTTGIESGGGTYQLSMWAGVATTTGSTNATVTTTAGSTIWVDIDAEQFTCTGVSATTTWATDGSAAASVKGTASTTLTYPSLTPSDTGRMYMAFGFPAGTSSTTGQTAGYTIRVDSLGNDLLFNTSVSGAQSPTNVITTSVKSTGIGALVYASNPASSTDWLTTPLVPRLRSFNW